MTIELFMIFTCSPQGIGARCIENKCEFSHNADELAELTPKWEAAATKLAKLNAEA